MAIAVVIKKIVENENKECATLSCGDVVKAAKGNINLVAEQLSASTFIQLKRQLSGSCPGVT